MNTGEQIRRIRESRNVTQEYMAAKLRMSKTSYGNIERDTVKRLALPTVMAIARVLQVHYSVLLADDSRYAEKQASEAGEPVLAHLRLLLAKVEGIEAQLQGLRQP